MSAFSSSSNISAYSRSPIISEALQQYISTGRAGMLSSRISTVKAQGLHRPPKNVSAKKEERPIDTTKTGSENQLDIKRIKMENGKTKRSEWWSQEEDDVLIACYRSQQNVLDAAFCTNVTRQRKREIFEEIAVQVCAVSKFQRSADQCKTHYKNMKSRYTKSRRELLNPLTGGGPFIDQKPYIALIDEYMANDCSIVGVNGVEIGDGNPIHDVALNLQFDVSDNDSLIGNDGNESAERESTVAEPVLGMISNNQNGSDMFEQVDDLSIRPFNRDAPENSIPGSSGTQQISSTANIKQTQKRNVATDREKTGGQQSMLNSYSEKCEVAIQKSPKRRFSNYGNEVVLDMEIEHQKLRNMYWKLMYDMKVEERSVQRVAFVTTIADDMASEIHNQVIETINNNIQTIDQ